MLIGKPEGKRPL